MFKISDVDISQWVRIGLYNLGAFLVTHGVAIGGGATWEWITGIVVTILTGAWTIWGNNAVNKLNQLIGANVIEIAVVKDAEVAAALPTNKVVSVADVKNKNVDTSTAAVEVVPKAA